MSLGYYIRELLEDHDYVVLPGFGAFTVVITEARFVEKNSRLLPPGRKISFTPDFRINDGILLNHFAHREHLTAAKAHQELAQIVEDIRYRLDHDETVEMSGLGFLTRQEGRYSFKAFQEAENWPGAYGLEPVEISLRKEPSPRDVTVSAGANAKKARKRDNFKKYYWFLVIPVLSAVLIFMLSPKENTLSPDEKSISDVASAADRNQEPYAADTMLMRSDSDEIQGIGQNPGILKNPPEEPSESQKGTGTIDATGEPVHPSADLYYLVGGSFKTRHNADQYFSKMKQQGYQPLHLGEVRSFHLVAIAFYASEREAVNAKNTILGQDSTSGVWVYHRSGQDE